MNPDRLAEQLRIHLKEAAQTRARMLTVVSTIDSLEPTASRRFGRATARYGVLQTEATMAWIEEVQELVAADAEVLSADRGPSA